MKDMETGVVIIQEPVLTKTSVEEAPAGVVLDHTTMEIDKVNLSTVLDGEITSLGIRKTDFAEVINGSGNKETKESKEEATKTISVEEDDSKIVKEKATDTKTVLSDVTLEKVNEDDIIRKPEEVISEKPVTEEVHLTETKPSQEVEKDIGNISSILVDTAPAKSGEDDIDSAREEILIKSEGVIEEKDSENVENSVNETENEHNGTVSVEEISRNGEDTVKETATEQETATNGVLVHDVEVTKRDLLEAEPRLDAKEEDETEIFDNEETRVDESESLKGDDHQRESAEPVESIKHSEDAEQISHELETENTRKTEEVQESLTVNDTRTVQEGDIESKASRDTEEDEHVLVRDIPQEDTLVSEAEIVNASTVQDTAILKTLETKSGETVTEPSLHPKEDNERKEEETVKTVASSDEVQETIAVVEPPKTEMDKEETENMPQDEIFVTEAESLVSKEDMEPVMDLKEDRGQEKTDNFEEIPSDYALKDDEIEVDQVAGAQTMEQQRGVETEESTVGKLVTHPDVESVEQMEKPSIESCSEVSEETSKTLDEKIEEEAPLHQEGQEKGSNGSETKEETVSKPESSLDLTPLPVEQDKESKLQEEKIHKYEPEKSEQVSSASPSEEQEGETVVEAKNISEIKASEKEEEEVADKTQGSVETLDNEPAKSNEEDKEESLSSAEENVHIDETDEVNEEKEMRTSVNETEEEHNAMVSEEGISRSIVNETVSDDAEKLSHEVTGEKEEDISPKTQEVQESSTVIGTQTIQDDNIELKDSKEHEHVLVRDMPHIASESTILKPLETTVYETEESQETKEDVEPSLDLKDGKEAEEIETTKTVISSDEAKHIDVQAEESVEVKSTENCQEESNEEKNENLLDVPSGELEKSNEPEVEQIDRNKADKAEQTNTTVDKKIKEKQHEEGLEKASYGLEIEEETLSASGAHKEEESSLPKETKLEEELIEKHELAEEVPNHQQIHAEEKSYQVTLEQEQETVSKKIEEEKVKEEEPIVQVLSEDVATTSQEIHKTGETAAIQEEQTRDIGSSLDEECSMDQTQSEEHVNDAQEKINSTENGETKANEHAVDSQTLTEAEAVETSVVRETAVLNILETKTNELEVVHSPLGGEEEPRLDMKDDNEQHETETVKTVIVSDEVIKDESQGREESVEVQPNEIFQREGTHDKDENVLDVPYADEKMQRPSLESPSELLEETIKTVDEKIDGLPEEEITPHQGGQEEGSHGLGTKEESEQAKEEESCLPNEQEKETKLQKEQTSEEEPDEVIQVSSAPLSGETLVEAEKIEDVKENGEEQVVDKIQTSLETVADAENIEDASVKETEPMGDMSDKGLETKDETESSELVAQSEEVKPKEILEGEKVEVNETKAEELPSTETTPQETLSDAVAAVEMKTKDNATESHKSQEKLSKDVETNETPVTLEEQTRDTKKGEIETKEPEHKNVGSSEKNDNGVPKQEESSRDVCITQEDIENVEAPKQEESTEDNRPEVSETVESKDDHTLPAETSEAYQTPPSFIEEVEDKIPTQIEEIHKEEKEEAEHKLQVAADPSLPVETLQEDQTLSLVPEQVEEIHEEEKGAHKLHEEEDEILTTEILTKESFSEAQVSMLASSEVDQVNVQEGNGAGDTLKESVGDEKPNKSEAEQTEKSDDKIENWNPIKVTKVDDEDIQGKSMDAFFGSTVEDENNSSLPVVGILQQLQNTLETERSIKDSAPSHENAVIEPAGQVQKRDDVEAEPSGAEDLLSIKAEPEALEKDIVTEISERVTNEKHDKTVPEEVSASETIEANELQQDKNGETEIIQEKELSLKEDPKVQDSISREIEVSVEEKRQEQEKTMISSSDTRFDDPKHVISPEKQQDVNSETTEKTSLQEEHPRDLEIPAKAEAVKEDQVFDTNEEKKNEDAKDEKLEGLSITRDVEESFRSEMKKDKEDSINELAASEKQTTEPPSETHKGLDEEHVESQDDTKSNVERDELSADKSPNQVGETVDALITSENVQVKSQSKGFEQEKKSNDLIYLEEDDGKNVKLVEEKKVVDYVKTEPEDAIKHGVSIEEKNNMSEKIDHKETKEMIYQEESKKTDTKIATNEEIKEEKKETAQECFNGIMNTDDDATEKTKPEMKEIEKFSSVSKTQDISKKDEVPKQESLKIAQELQEKEPEATVKEPARKSLSNLIQKVEGTNKSEDATKEVTHMEEEAKTEEDDEDGDEHKDDKGSTDSMVMVEAKETVSIVKTQHKKSQGILSGVGSKVKHSISKVKKALTGKSSRTTKPSSPPNL